MAKPNYKFAKRAVDMAKKKKQEEKRQRKLEKKKDKSGENPDQPEIETADEALPQAQENAPAPAARAEGEPAA